MTNLAIAEDRSSGRVLAALHSGRVAWVVLAFSILLTATAWNISNRGVQAQISKQFEKRTREIELAIAERMHTYEQLLRGGAGLFAASAQVTRDEWRRYVEALAIEERYPGVQGIGFSVRIPAADKAAHVAAVRAEGFPNYDIRPSGPRSEYHSIIFLEPFRDRNLRAFGFDMSTDSVRQAAMWQARDTGQPAATGRVTLVQETLEDVQHGFLMYVPVYRGIASSTPASRRAALVGFVYSPFRVKDLMRGTLGHEVTDIRYEIYDGDLSRPNLLVDSAWTHTSAMGPSSRPLLRTTGLPLAGRSWTIRFTPGPTFRAGSSVSQPLIVAVAGLLIDILLFAIIRSLSRTQRQAVAIAFEITAQLRASAVDLEARSRELERSNRELERFAYVASHDLRSPLRAIEAVSHWLEQDLAGALTPDSREHLRLLRGRVARMNQLLVDLLAYGRVSRDAPDDDVVVVAESIEHLREFFSARGKIVVTGSLPRLQTTRILLDQVLRNLVDNAFKHHDGSDARVEIGCRPVDQGFEFSVSDNGPGIPERFHQRIFEIFRTLRPRDEVEGSGMGLALVKKIVEQRGGSVRLESHQGVRGSRFIFTWPASPIAPPR